MDEAEIRGLTQVEVDENEQDDESSSDSNNDVKPSNLILAQLVTTRTQKGLLSTLSR